MACGYPAWAHGLTDNNLNYEGVIEGEMLEKTLELHKRDTVSTFGTRSSRRATTSNTIEIREDESRLVSKLTWTNRSSIQGLLRLPLLLAGRPGLSCPIMHIAVVGRGWWDRGMMVDFNTQDDKNKSLGIETTGVFRPESTKFLKDLGRNIC